MKLARKLDDLIAKHDELQNQLASQTDMGGQEYARLSREFTELTDVVKAAERYRATEAEIRDLESLVNDSGSDGDVKALAEEEFRELKQLLPKLEREMQLLLLPKYTADKKNAVLEVRAGTGGEEAALFAADLFRMYQRFSEYHDWTFEFIDLNETGIGGYKEATACVTGKDVFSKLKFESGVHRVQRVPETESQGRVHTSAATVAVLQEAEEVDIEVDTKDLRIDTFRAQGASPRTRPPRTATRAPHRWDTRSAPGTTSAQHPRTGAAPINRELYPRPHQLRGLAHQVGQEERSHPSRDEQ